VHNKRPAGAAARVLGRVQQAELPGPAARLRGHGAVQARNPHRNDN